MTSSAWTPRGRALGVALVLGGMAWAGSSASAGDGRPRRARPRLAPRFLQVPPPAPVPAPIPGRGPLRELRSGAPVGIDPKIVVSVDPGIDPKIISERDPNIDPGIFAPGIGERVALRGQPRPGPAPIVPR